MSKRTVPVENHMQQNHAYSVGLSKGFQGIASSLQMTFTWQRKIHAKLEVELILQSKCNMFSKHVQLVFKTCSTGFQNTV